MWYFMNKKEVFKKILMKLRKERGFTQEKLAEKAGINGKYFGRIERGDSSPTINKVFEICDALDIKTSEFIEQVENYKK